jgi:hypothetical protein
MTIVVKMETAVVRRNLRNRREQNLTQVAARFAASAFMSAMPLSGVEALCRAVTPRRRKQLPGADARSKFDWLSAFATPAENSRSSVSAAIAPGALIWIPTFL